MQILLVEDNPGDVRLVREALYGGGGRERLHVAADGVDAIRFLRRDGEHARAPRPDVILLDLNLPRMGGREVLEEIKSDPVLRRIPVVVLSGSAAREDVSAAYDLHANCYVTKPVDLDDYLATVRATVSFWGATVIPAGE